MLIYLIAGEPSGDILAARLMTALRERTGGAVAFAGIGGEAMRAQGLDSLFPQADLAVMGLAEVVPRIPRVLRRLRETLADIEARQPAAIVTIDSWGFTGRVAKRLMERGSTVPRIHYVAPMVWAWREKRAQQLAGRVDLLLCLLPNEPDYFRKFGLTAVHVGHPVLEGSSGDGTGFRARHGIGPDVPLLCVLPGSRRSETSRLLGVFGQTVGLLTASRPDLRVVVPTVETVAESVGRAVAGWPTAVPPILVQGAGERAAAFAASRAALAASGTVALELAMAKVPMVIAYRLAPLTHFVVDRLVKVRYACLLNILEDRAIVPEFLQTACRPEFLAPAVASLLADGPERTLQLAGAAAALERLRAGVDRPSWQAAGHVLHMIDERAER